MNQPAPSLWWAYDSESGGFSALPATPLIVPAAIILAVFSGFRWLFCRPKSREKLFGPIVHTNYYTARQARFTELINMRVTNGDLEIHEWKEYYDLQFFLQKPNRFLP
jgi:hypothetical protein